MTVKAKGAIMLLRNMDPRNGHCNGTRYSVERDSDRLIEAKMIRFFSIQNISNVRYD